MDPHIQLWLVVFGVCAGMFVVGLIYGYWLGRNSKIAGVINLEPIQRLPTDEQPYREVLDLEG